MLFTLTLLYVQLITLSTQLTPFYMCLDPLNVHFLVWPEGRYVAHDICSVYTRPPSRNTNTSLTTRLLSGPRGEQTAVTVCVESPVTQRHLRHKGMMVSDRCRGGRGKKAPEWQARTGSQLLWRQLGRQAHTEPTRRGKWLNTPRTSNDFFFFFYNLKLSFLSPHNSNTVTAIQLPAGLLYFLFCFFKHMWQLSGSRRPLIEECTANVSV